MPKFSQLSVSKLSTCHPDLQKLMFEVIKYRDCTILEGHRGQAEQEAAFAAGNSKLHYPFGNHNAIPSNAVDCMPYPIEWNNKERIIYFAGFVMGIAEMLFQQGKITHHIRWGGDWNRTNDPSKTSFFDGAHFEIHS